MLYWGLCQTSNNRAVPKNNGHLGYIDTLKVYATSETQLNALLCSSSAMQDIYLQWNPKKCNVLHIRRGKHVHDMADLELVVSYVVRHLRVRSDYNA